MNRLTRERVQQIACEVGNGFAADNDEVISLCSMALALEAIDGEWFSVESRMPKMESDILFKVNHFRCYGVEKGNYDGLHFVSDRTGPNGEAVAFNVHEVDIWCILPTPPASSLEDGKQ